MMVAQDLQQECRLSRLLAGLVESVPECRISGMTLDSRAVRPGDLFIACSGVTGHGLDFVGDAATNGAVAIICETDAAWDEPRLQRLAQQLAIPLITVAGLKRQVSRIAGRFYHHPSEKLTVIGVTGTNGKSTVCQMLAQMLDLEKGRCAVIGTLGNGFPDALQPSTHTTPDPISLQCMLAGFQQQGAAAVAMEISSHALSQWRAAAVHFNFALLTNLSRDHLDYHQDMEDYAAAKQRLFEMPDLDCAVLNYDDSFGREVLQSLSPDLPIVLYSLDAAMQPPERAAGWVRVDQIKQNLNGMQLQLTTHLGSTELKSPLLGRFNAANLMAVLALLLQHGWSLQRVVERLAQVSTVPGRMERFGGEKQPLVVVDYAHTPDALEQVLQALRPHCGGRLICLFGCGGDRDRGKRPLMGEVAARLSDQLVLTDDNPRGEDGGRIIDEIKAAVPGQTSVLVERNRAHAIRQAIAMAKPDDLVLIAGKGHETTQLVGDLKLPFSDREQVAKVLSEMGAGK